MSTFLRTALLMTLLGFIMTGCASSPKVTFYTLTPVSAQSDATPLDTVVAVGPGSLPREIQRNQIITRPEPSVIKVNETQRWAGSLELIFDRTVAENLERLLPAERVSAYPVKAPASLNYRVIINVRQFDGDTGEAVTLRGSFTITDKENKAVTEQTFSIVQPADGGSFEALVNAHNGALATLSAQIAAAMPR